MRGSAAGGNCGIGIEPALALPLPVLLSDEVPPMAPDCDAEPPNACPPLGLFGLALFSPSDAAATALYCPLRSGVKWGCGAVGGRCEAEALGPSITFSSLRTLGVAGAAVLEGFVDM